MGLWWEREGLHDKTGSTEGFRGQACSSIILHSCETPILLVDTDPKDLITSHYAPSIKGSSQVQVAHNYNPSNSGGRDQEDHSSKPAQASSKRPYLEKPFTKIGLVE
jgi:hypothetical protein